MVTFQYTKFLNLSIEGNEDIESFGYRIYSDEKGEYANYFDKLSDLMMTINKNNIKEFLREYHSDFFEIINMDGKVNFNGTVILI
jgi:hypothetical protein